MSMIASQGVKPFTTKNLAFSDRAWGTVHSAHGLINYKDTKIKFRHLKKFTCKWTLRQMFIRVFRLEIQSVMLVFSTEFCELKREGASVRLTPAKVPLQVNSFR
jgi:hypothetical protein